MFILFFFAFLAGVVTIVSPCVLPVLPLLLSTSSSAGRLRPLGVVLGFAGAFTAFTLAGAAAADALAIPAVWLRTGAILLLLAFGLTLIVPAWGEAVERLLAPLARLVNTGQARSGFGGGLVLGGGLGLLWAPCVGPIMASVIAITALSGLSGSAVAITLAYSLGAALPMLLIGYGARGLATRTRRFGRQAAGFRRAFGVLTVVGCITLLLGLDLQLQAFARRSLPPEWSNALISVENGANVQREIRDLESRRPASNNAGTGVGNVAALPAQDVEPTLTAPPPTAAPLPTPAPTEKPRPEQPALGLKDLGPAPELTGITGWLNTNGPLTMASLRGKVVIVDFWTFGCYNCRNTRPYVRALYDKYHSRGLEIIGVHTPEFSYERVPENIRAAAKEQGVTWPVAFDPNYKTWSAYSNRYWPAFYFIDAKGRLRYTHFGEGNYEFHDKVVAELLAEAGR